MGLECCVSMHFLNIYIFLFQNWLEDEGLSIRCYRCSFSKWAARVLVPSSTWSPWQPSSLCSPPHKPAPQFDSRLSQFYKHRSQFSRPIGISNQPQGYLFDLNIESNLHLSWDLLERRQCSGYSLMGMRFLVLNLLRI